MVDEGDIDMMDGKQVDCSIYMLTYYHEKYVGMAIESILSQRTQYSYEIVISDDCSGDGTAAILKSYEKRYPNLIRVMINSENIGISRNIYQARCMCRGRYIIDVSGDDYVIDVDKIERGISFLDRHPEYYSLYNLVEIRYGDSQKALEIRPSKKYWNRRYSIKDYERGNTLASHGFIMRNDFLTEEGRAYFRKSQEISNQVDDAVDTVLILRRGPAFLIGIATDAHRIIVGDKEHNYNSRFTKIEKVRHQFELYDALYKEFGSEIDFSWWYSHWFMVGFLEMLMTREYKLFLRLFKTIPKEYKRGIKKNVYIRLLPFSLLYVYNRLSSKLKYRLNQVYYERHLRCFFQC